MSYTVEVSGAEGARIVEVHTSGIQAPSTTRTSVTATETIAAASFVNFVNEAGALKAQLADATDGTKPCDGYATAAIADAAAGTVIVGRGQVLTGLTGLTIGADYYLSETAGAITSTPPSTVGNLVQYIGKALSATTLLYDPDRGTLL